MTVAPGRAPFETVVTGAGAPVTLFLPGLAGSIAQTRPFGSGVAGTRVFAHLPGHGATPAAPEENGDVASHAGLAAGVRALLDSLGATAALGVSLGAVALLTALADGTGVDRLVLCLPPAARAPDGADPVVARFAAMADAVDAADVEVLARHLRDQQPAAVRGLPAVGVWSRRHAADLIAGRGTGLAAVLRSLPPTVPAPDLEALAETLASTDILIVAQQGDEAHPVAVARTWALALGARLEVLGPGAVPWRGRERLRDLISGHLNGGRPAGTSTPPGPPCHATLNTFS